MQVASYKLCCLFSSVLLGLFSVNEEDILLQHIYRYQTFIYVDQKILMKMTLLFQYNTDEIEEVATDSAQLTSHDSANESDDDELEMMI